MPGLPVSRYYWEGEEDCWVPDAAEQQQLREGEAARQAERDAVMTDEASKKYTLRTCPCCPGKGPETRSPEKQELINFIKQNGIESEIGRGDHSICATFHPQELFTKLSIHLANHFFNAYNTEELIRWKIQYLYYHCDLQKGVENVDWVKKGLAMGNYEMDPEDDDCVRANVPRTDPAQDYGGSAK